MKKRVLALLCALAVAGTGQNILPAFQVSAAETAVAGTTYYFSSLHGDNSKDGTSANTAWETLDKLKSVTLQPGDQVLLEKGSVFNGYIHLQDVHGTEEAPIRVSSYGTEGASKPVIDAKGQGVWYQTYSGMMDNTRHRSKGYVSSTILLYDVDYVEVSDLEIVNTSDDFDFFPGAVSSVSKTSGRMDRTGVSGIAKDGGTMEHVYLDNLYIHDVNGNIQDKHMNNGGIQMNVVPPEDEDATGIARYDDIRITNCYVKDVSRAGICVGYTYQNSKFNGQEITDATARTYGHTNLVIEGNYVQNAGNDAIVAMYAYRPLVQKNVSDKSGADMETEKGYGDFWQHLCAAVWPWKCKDGIFQYNEVFDTVGDNNQDAQPWDIDYSDGTIYQYNYSHNNGGGCIMFCGGEAYRGVFRYNISQNDLRSLIHLAGNPNGEIYNNVFYIDGDLSTTVFGGAGTADIRNNIFYNTSTNKSTGDTFVQANRTYSNNIFYGYDQVTLPEGALKVDPKFVDPGKAPVSSAAGGTLHDRDVFAGYKLQDDSPAINAGVAVAGAPKYDFFGNRVGVQPDIGAFESAKSETTLAVQGISLTVEDGKITNVPEGMTVAELKEKLIYAQDVTLDILKGTQQAEDSALVSSDMKVKLTKGAETKEYTLEITASQLAVTSVAYSVSADKISGIKRGTSVRQLLGAIFYDSGIICKVFDAAGKEYTGSDEVKSGYKVKLTKVSDGSAKEYTVEIMKSYEEYDPTTMTGTVGSYQPNNNSEGNANLALDNNMSTLWHTAWSGCAQSDVWITLDLGTSKRVGMFKYVPRPSGGVNGIITKYKVEVSNDNTNWTEVASGTWAGDSTTKYATFTETNARYVKLSGLESRSQNEGLIFGSAAEVRVGYEAAEE